MIAVPVTGDLRLAVVGAPAYFARRGRPTHEIWEFTENERNFSVTVPARVLSTDAALNRRLAIAGLGITMAYEGHVRDAPAEGRLISVLKEFCAPCPGYYLYYPQRRNASRALQALVAHLRQWR